MQKTQQIIVNTQQEKLQYHSIKENINENGNGLEICVWGIEKFFDQKQCLRFFKKNFVTQDYPLNFTHISKPHNKPYFHIRFSSSKELESFFNSPNANNKKIRVKQAKYDTSYERFLSIQQLAMKKQQKRQRKIATKQDLQQTINSKIQDIVQPYHKLSYEKQIEEKTQSLEKAIENYNIQFFKDSEVKSRIKAYGNTFQPLRLTKFIMCQNKRTQYRNKTQFTIGKNSSGNVTVGFNKGSFQKNTIMIQDPRNVSIVSKKTKMVASILEKYIRENGFDVFDRFDQTGFWRYLVVRESERTKQILILIVGADKNMEVDALLEIKKNLVEIFRRSIIGLVGLCFLGYNASSDSIPTEKPEILWGQGHYHQKILDISFQISSTAFLQGHTQMCQVLYSKIIQLISQCQVVLDLCCGIGTIGICIKNKFKEAKVIGIQMCQQAVLDARINDENYQIMHAKVEDGIKQITQKYRGRRIVGILDPPRAGVNKDVITALRRCRGLDHIIYVACSPASIQDNLLQLTLPVTNKRKAPQFKIKQMYGFDLFPQTKHYEALYYLQRT